MSHSLNKVQIIGNIGKDPEVRNLNNGEKVANLRVACSEKWKDKSSGEQKERTEWVSVVIFGKLAEIAEKFVRTGSKIYVEGKLTTRKWVDKTTGADKYSTEVVLNGFNGQLILLDSKNSGGGQQQQAPQQQQQPQNNYQQKTNTGFDNPF
jgi:single-strand DNA-binding protein